MPSALTFAKIRINANCETIAVFYKLEEKKLRLQEFVNQQANFLPHPNS